MTNKHAQALGKLGGKVKSEKKAKSSRLNGLKGGRPKKEKLMKTLLILALFISPMCAEDYYINNLSGRDYVTGSDGTTGNGYYLGGVYYYNETNDGGNSLVDFSGRDRTDRTINTYDQPNTVTEDRDQIQRINDALLLYLLSHQEK